MKCPHAVSTTPPPSGGFSEAEAKYYYSGVSFEPPRLVFRSDRDKRPWKASSWIRGTALSRYAMGVFGHKLNDVWDTGVGDQVKASINALNVNWTSIDVVRFTTLSARVTGGDVSEIGPVVIWIGVVPGSLSYPAAERMSNDILLLLQSFDINDVEVECRESVFRRLAGLLPSAGVVDPTAGVRIPLTPTLGLPIAVSGVNGQGSMCLVFAEGGESKRLLGLTCHHVLSHVDKDATTSEVNYKYHPSAPRRSVQVMCPGGFEDFLESIQKLTEGKALIVSYWKNRIAAVKRGEGSPTSIKELEGDLMRATAHVTVAEKFYQDSKKLFGKSSQRTIGHVVAVPPLAFDVGPHGITEDWGAFEINDKMFGHFECNSIDLGAEFDSNLFNRMMYPRRDGVTKSKYPAERFLNITGVLSVDQLKRPDTLDVNQESCIIVLKRGIKTGLTMGRATGVFSYVRDEATGQESKEWAILRYDKKSEAFCGPGDSGSAVVDGFGRIGGMLTGGCGPDDDPIITYASPWEPLWALIKSHFPKAHISPPALGNRFGKHR